MEVDMKRFVILVTLTLAACSAPRDSVQDFVKNAGAGMQGSAPPVVESPRYVPATYDAQGLRDPFAAPRKRVAPQPEAERRDPLEAYSLETLRMIGTVRKDGTMFALVRAPDGLVHPVRAGNRMGLNFGRVTAISEAAITLVELVADGAEATTREVVVNLVEAS